MHSHPPLEKQSTYRKEERYALKSPLRHTTIYSHKNPDIAKIISIELSTENKNILLTFNNNDSLISFFQFCPSSWQTLEKKMSKEKVEMHIDVATIKSDQLPHLAVSVADNRSPVSSTPTFSMELDRSDSNLPMFKELLFVIRQFETIDMNTLRELSVALGVNTLITLDDVISCSLKFPTFQAATEEAQFLNQLSNNVIFKQIQCEQLFNFVEGGGHNIALWLAAFSPQQADLFLKLGHYYLAQKLSMISVMRATMCYTRITSEASHPNSLVCEAKVQLALLEYAKNQTSEFIPITILERMFVDAYSSQHRNNQLIATLFHRLCGHSEDTPVLNVIFDGNLQTYLQISQHMRQMNKQLNPLPLSIASSDMVKGFVKPDALTFAQQTARLALTFSLGELSIFAAPSTTAAITLEEHQLPSRRSFRGFQ